MRNRFMILIGLLLVGGGVGVGRRMLADEPAASPKMAAECSPEKTVRALGTIEPEDTVDVYAQVSGKITNLGSDPRGAGKSIDYCSPVKEGALLAQIDNELYAARVERERAGCARAEAELELAAIHMRQAEVQWKEVQDQKKNKAISESEFDLAKFNYCSVS